MIEHYKRYTPPRIKDMTYLGDIPKGSQLMTCNQRVYIASPGQPLHEVTVNGLVEVAPTDLTTLRKTAAV